MYQIPIYKLSALAAFLGLAFSANAAASKVYQEANGVVVIEAEHFDTRVADPADATHTWKIIPDEDPGTGSGPDRNARGNKYIQSLPDAGQNQNSGPDIVGIPPYVEYKVAISTPGVYRLFLRFGGFDGASDSIYAQIVEMKKANGGPGPDWYRYVGQWNPADDNTIVDFALVKDTTTGGAAVGWNGDGEPNGNDGGGGEVAAVYTLNSGLYTIRVSQREDGSAFDALLLQLSSLPQPTNPGPAESPLATFYISQGPTDVIATPGKTATFTVAAVGTGTITYQWQSKAPGAADFSNIANATSATYTTGAVTDAMGGTQYRVVVTNGTATSTSGAATLITDSTPPSVILANSSPSLNQVTVTFSEKLDPTSAATAANYAINNGVTVSSATLDSSGKVVTLSTSALTGGTAYTLTVKGVKDVAGNAITSATSNFEGATHVAGALRVDLWFNIPGTAMDALTSDPRYPDKPDRTTFWTVFGPFSAGNNYGDNFGGQVTGWIVPPVTGNYKFYLRSDDAGQLFLSSDDTKAKETMIAEQTGCCNAFTDQEGTLSSTPIALTAGKRYYVRGMYKEGGGDDYIQVGWRTPSDPDLNAPPTTVIPGKYLETLADPTAAITITKQPTNVTAAANTPVAFTVGFTALSAFGTNGLVQWQKAPAGSTTFADIAGATSPSYAIQFASSSDSGAQFRAAITAGGTTVSSNPATLTVGSDTVPPTVTSVSGSVSSVAINFSEPLDATTAGNKANYQLSGGGTVSSATLTSGAGQAGTVRLAVSGLTAGTTYTLTIGGVKDVAGNVIAATTKTFIAYHINDNFNDGQTPAGATINGNATVKAAGSYDGSGFIELTPNLGSQQGTIVFDDPLKGGTATKLTATFKLFIGNGSGNPADGVSFSVAGDINPTDNFGEEGGGTALIVSFDTYNNGNDFAGNPEAPAISVKWGGPGTTPDESPIDQGGTQVVKTNLAKATLVNNRWVDVGIQVDSSGRITVQHDNVKYFDNVKIPGWTPIVAPKVALGGRTGGENEDNWVDDVRVVFNSDVSLPQPPTITLTSPANGATFAPGSDITATVDAAAPGGTITKVTYYANGSRLADITTAPYSLTVPKVAAGDYLIYATVTGDNGITVQSKTARIIVGDLPAKILFVTADPGPLTFAGDQAVLAHLQGRNLTVDLSTGAALPSDGSAAQGYGLVIISSSLSSGTVGDKLQNAPIPVIEWESALQDNFMFQADDSTKGTSTGLTDISITDAKNPLAAGLSVGVHTVLTAAENMSWGTPLGDAHIAATMTDDPTHACIYWYEKGAKGYKDFIMPARRAFFFYEDNSARSANADAWKLFDAAVDWLRPSSVTPPPQPKLSVSRSGNNLTISWTGTGTLQKAAKVTGPWTDVPGTSPQTQPMGGQAQFFRVKQ